MQNVRSKNAGPFWITTDIVFHDSLQFDHAAHSKALQPAQFAALYGVDESHVKVFLLPDLLTIKISYPRCAPQGGYLERDMHSGQQYIRLLNIAI